MVMQWLRGVVLLLVSANLLAQQAAEHVSLSGDIDDDVYLAGGQVELYATVQGDVVVAGGQLNLEGDVRADLIAAGGDIDLRGTVADDARLAGGNLRVRANIGDDLVAAAGRIQIAPASEIGGSAWLSAGDVFVDGRIAQELRANAGRVIVNGTIEGNVEIWAEHIEINSSAVILGKLHYTSPHPARIAQGARIEGKVSHTPVDVPVAPLLAGLLFIYVIFMLSLVVTALVLYLLFPGVAERCSQSVRTHPWHSLAYGLAVFAATPVVVVLLLSTGLGALPGLLLFAAYLVVLLSGYIAGVGFVAETSLRKLKKDRAGRGMQLVSLGLTVIALSMLNLVPVLGSLLNWLVLLAGIGALTQQLVTAYKAAG